MNWWSLFIKGLIFLLFGILAIFFPDKALLSVIIYLGLIILLGGIIFLIASLVNRNNKKPWEFLMFEGVIDVLIGILIMVYPGPTLKFLILLIGIWSVVMGIYLIISYFSPQTAKNNKMFYLISGLFASLFGLMLIFNPSVGGAFVTVLIGICTIVIGALLVSTAMRLRKKVK